MTITILTCLVSVAGIILILWRFWRMLPGVTQSAIVLQHAVAFLGLVGALFLPPQLGLLSVSSAFAWFLLAGAHRWLYAAPPGTDNGAFDDKPIERTFE